MFKKGLLILFACLYTAVFIQAQTVDSTEVVNINKALETVTPDDVPVITYNTSKKYEIADIKLIGITDPDNKDFVYINFSGLAVGEIIEVPGNEITNAVKRFWKQQLFSDVKILATKVEGNKIWLEIRLKERPRISDITFSGMKKGERQDLTNSVGLVKNLQVTPSQLDRAKIRIKKYFDDKGFNNAVINITQKPDVSKENYVILNIDVIKKNKTKVNRVTIEGNKEVSVQTLEKSMKKTRHKSTLRAWIRNFLRSTKYVPESYEEDKTNLIAKYNELGYRDATIVWDTVYAAVAEGKPDKMDIVIKVDEGNQYFLRKIDWVGNTKYPTAQLNAVLTMKNGDVYNQKKLTDRLTIDDDAVMNYFYQNNGYLFSRADPVEVNIENDSIDLEVRITEGPQATIRKVAIAGNDRLYEDVIRRELRTKPGALYSRDDIMRTLREIAQMGHFDPEALNPDIQPDYEDGVVDIGYNLVSKANDQIEFSAGWGQTGLIGKLSLRFTNFSLKNLFNPGTYKGIIPQGEGQTLTLSAQTNAKYYQSYSVSFMDPWFGGKRPNSLSVGAYYSKQTDINSNYLSSAYSGSGYGYGSSYYGSGNSYYSDLSQYALDPNKSIQMIGLSVGYGKRLNWPDDNFFVQAEMAYQLYKMKDWQYFMVKDGTANSLNFSLSLNRRSIDNPLYTRRGTDFSVSVQFTPPFSLFDGKDYKNMEKVTASNGYQYETSEKYRWIEYHKWKLKFKTYTPLADVPKKTPVLMTRVEYGLLGYFNKYKKSPFETFYVGGSGMSGYSNTYATETIALRGYEDGSLGSQASAYARLGVEIHYPLILEPSSTIYLVGFVEAGNAWYNVTDFNPFDLKRSAGVGARIILPMIGLMGIDWAYGFDPLPTGFGTTSRSNSGSQIHFVLGQEF